jgi:hypothetical protein
MVSQGRVAGSAVAGLLVVAVFLGSLVVFCGWRAHYLAMDLWSAGHECDPAPDEPARVAAERVFQQLPATATPDGQPQIRQPCDVESDYTGAYGIEYTSGLNHDQIAKHYADLARKSGWDLRPDESFDHSRLVYGTKWTRSRCLWLTVGRDTQGRPRRYYVEIEFWPKYSHSFCD